MGYIYGMRVSYIQGDATNPCKKGNKIVIHIVNSVGKWGSGFVMAVSKKWPHVREAYLDWYNNRHSNDFELGAVQFVEAQQTIWIANMVGQKGIHTGSKGPPIRYEALRLCLQKVENKARELNASVHGPMIGCGLAGGDPEKIKKLLQDELGDKEIDTTIYLL